MCNDMKTQIELGKSVKNLMFESIGVSLLTSTHYLVSDSVNKLVYNSVYSSVYWSVGDSIKNKVWRSVKSSVRDSINNSMIRL